MAYDRNMTYEGVKGAFRKCRSCGKWKLRNDDNFWRVPSKRWIGRYCKQCRSEPRIVKRIYTTVIGATCTKNMLLTEREKMIQWFGGKCAYCNLPLPTEYRGIVIEHFRGIKAGGESTHDNLVISCRSCNQSKGGRDVYKWLVKKFGEKHAKETLVRINQFFSIAHTVYSFYENPAQEASVLAADLLLA